MTLPYTDIAAWWGGITSTVLFLFEIVRFIKERPGFRIDIEYEYEDEYLLRKRPTWLKYTITNTSERATTIRGVALTKRQRFRRFSFARKYRFYASGIVDETLGKNYPQKIESGEHIIGRIDAGTIRKNARDACGSIVFCVTDTLHHRPRCRRLKIPAQFLEKLPPLTQKWNEIEVVGPDKAFEEFKDQMEKMLKLEHMRFTKKGKNPLLFCFPCGTVVQSNLVTEVASATGVKVVEMRLNTVPIDTPDE